MANTFKIALSIMLVVYSSGTVLNEAKANKIVVKDIDIILTSEQMKSYTSLYNKKYVKLVDRVKGRGKRYVSDILKSKFTNGVMGINTRNIIRTKTTDKHIEVYGNEWRLKVSGDGTKFSYRNYPYFEKSKKEKYKPNNKITKYQVFKKGRKFIDANLRELVIMGDKDQLVPFRVQYEIDVIQPGDMSTPPEEETVAAVAVFTRKFDNIPIVGAGSKIAVLMNNSGEIYGFDVDWPIYEYNSKKNRVQKIDKLDNVLSRSKIIDRLPKKAISRRQDRFDCGYVDMGYRKRDYYSKMQIGCYSFYSGKVRTKEDDSKTSVYAYVDVIPAGETIVDDQLWFESKEILKKDTYGMEGKDPGSI